MRKHENFIKELNTLTKIMKELSNILELPETVEELKPAIDCLYVEVREQIQELLKNRPSKIMSESKSIRMNPSENFKKMGEKFGHELNLLYQSGQYLTSKGWKSNEALGKMVFDLIKEVD